jgi:hypothetical protein
MRFYISVIGQGDDSPRPPGSLCPRKRTPIATEPKGTATSASILRSPDLTSLFRLPSVFFHVSAFVTIYTMQPWRN